MLQTFHDAESFNQPLGRWNVAQVRDMRDMFHGAKSFNQPIEGWNVARVKNMQNMFKRCPIDDDKKPARMRSDA